MSVRDYSLEALIKAEDNGMLTSWSFEQEPYSVVEEHYDPAVIQKIENVLKPDSPESLKIVYSLLFALDGQEKTTKQLAYELGFGSRLPLLWPYIQMALEAGLIEHVTSTNESPEYWKIAR